MAVYVSKKSRKEDAKSTAGVFLPFSIIGFVLLALFAADLLPIHVSAYQKVLICAAMGVVLLSFFLVGLSSLRQLKSLGAQSDIEADAEAKILSWFRETYPAAEIDAAATGDGDDMATDGNDAADDAAISGDDTAKTDDAADSEKETLYFKRYDVMARLIAEQYPGLEESFLDHLIEELYAKIFEE